MGKGWFKPACCGCTGIARALESANLDDMRSWKRADLFGTHTRCCKPTCPTLVLGNPAFRAAVRRRLHVPCLPTAGPCSDCVCGQKAAEIGPDHALNCPNVWGLTVSRHDELAKAVRDALSRAGATTLRRSMPTLNAMPVGGKPSSHVWSS